jgi:hypothetical protein
LGWIDGETGVVAVDEVDMASYSNFLSAFARSRILKPVAEIFHTTATATAIQQHKKSYSTHACPRSLEPVCGSELTAVTATAPRISLDVFREVGFLHTD